MRSAPTSCCSGCWRRMRRMPARCIRCAGTCSRNSPTRSAWKTRPSGRRSSCATRSGGPTSWPSGWMPSRPSSVPGRDCREAVMSSAARILVVDDDADMLRLLSLRLHAAGYLVTAVPTAEDALAQLAAQRPHLVLSDVRLPGRDGLSLFDEIRVQHPSLPVILLTAHGTIPDAVEATARGVFGYLTKPYEPRELLEKISQAVALGADAATEVAPDEAWREEIISRSAHMAELLAEA